MSLLFALFSFFFAIYGENTCHTNVGACSIQDEGIYDETVVSDVFIKSILNSNDVVIFYAFDCPHCKEARDFLGTIKERFKVLEFEIKRSKENLALFKKACSCNSVVPSGIPVIFVRNKVFIGFNDGIKNEIQDLLATKHEYTASKYKTSIYVPFLGVKTLGAIKLLPFSIYLGFLDGLNPCAMWVLVFLLSLLISTHSRKKMLVIGGTFILASALVYFAFMMAWFNVFSVIGYSSFVTFLLGIIAVVMGLINIKELFFFKKGVSLMIPENVKPTLYKKLRAVINTKSTLLAILGTGLLAVFVNFIELACTVGLPAVFTRILSLKNISVFDKYWYMAIYNIAYIIPLFIIVSLFIVFMERFVFQESHAKILKLISGLLMLSLGVIIIFFPKLLF